jgi:translation factor GUF1, mitochondrial
MEKCVGALAFLQMIFRRLMSSSARVRIPPERIRNFGIIAHVDHGKSTLADRLLEVSRSIRKDRTNQQVLDKLSVERERGITVKAQTVSMFYEHAGERYLLNLIDTPGHIDFHYEVSRSLAACQGILLVVDASQGIQAQTLANYYLAADQNLTIIPILNKIDLPHANVKHVSEELKSMLDIDTKDIIQVSAKSGLNVDQVLPAIIERIPAPQARLERPLQALLFDLWHDAYKGIVCLVSIKQGTLKPGMTIVSHHTKQEYEIVEIGLLRPSANRIDDTQDMHIDAEGRMPVQELIAGQVGYVLTTMKKLQDACVGDTFYQKGNRVDALPGFKPSKPMVFAGLFPMDASEYQRLHHALQKLYLSDSSVTITPTTSSALGLGFHVGFLGMLHMDVFKQRLETDFFGDQVLITAPFVGCRIEDETNPGVMRLVKDPREFPVKPGNKCRVEEPFVNATIVTPEQYLGSILNLCERRRGEQNDVNYISSDRVILQYRLPLTELAHSHFFNELKQYSSGYASFDYDPEPEYDQSDLVRMDVVLNGESIDALTSVCHQSVSEGRAREMASRLSELLSRDLFEIRIQVMVNGKSVARETLGALRKDVTAKCYGGDQTRKRKLLEKQKEGKKRMKSIGKVQLSHESFLKLIAR